jgi:hypothetical protein
MKKEADSPTDRIFQELNKDDADHAMRIRSYMEEHGISVKLDNGS